MSGIPPNYQGASKVPKTTDKTEIKMKANSYYEITYREWILRIISEQGFITKADAINAGAEVVGCSIETSRPTQLEAFPVSSSCQVLLSTDRL